MRHLLKILFLYIVVLCSYAQALEFAIKNFSPYEILFIQDSYLKTQNGITAQNLCNNGVQEACDRIHWHYAPLYHIWGKNAERLKIQQKQWGKRERELYTQYINLCDNTDIFGTDYSKNPAKHPLKLLLKSSRQLFLSIQSLVHYHSPHLSQAEQNHKEHCVALSHSIYEVESYNFRRKEYFRPTFVDNALLASCLKYDNLISCMQTYHPLGSLYGAFLAKYDKNLADSTFAHSTLDTSLLLQAIFSQFKLKNAYEQIYDKQSQYIRLCDTLEKQTQISLIHKHYPLSEPITSPYNLPFLCIAYEDNGTIYDQILPFAESDKWSEEQAKQVCQKMRESTQSKGHFITLETLYDLEKLNANFLKQKQETMAIFSKLCENKDELNSLFAYPCQNLESVHYATLRTYLPAEGACQGGILLRHKAEYDKELKETKAKRQQECQKRQCCCVD
nr:hypothetical protein [uncultured Helicobacter sp.]